MKCFRCFSDSWEFIKQYIATLHSLCDNLLMALSLIVDGRLSTISKCSAYPFKIGSLSVRIMLPSALRSGVVPELFGS